MDLDKYLSPLLRWWWLLLLAVLLSAGASYAVVSRQPPAFEASTTLIFGQSFSSPNPNSGQIYLEQQMAAIYADMGNREVTWTKVQDALGMNWLPQYVVRALPNTALIEVTVTDTEPERARLVADEVARQMILLTPGTISVGSEEEQAFTQEQVEKLRDQIETTELDIVRMREAMGDMTSARQIQDAETQINALETKLTVLQTTYASLLSNSAEGALNTLTVIQPALTPTEPSSPSKWLLTGLAGVVGLVLAVLGAYVIEYFDHSVKSVDEVAEITGVPVIGRLAKIGRRSHGKLHLLSDPFTPEVNVFRSLRTQLEILGVGHTIRTVLIFSPGVAEGKSTVALNLAAVFSNTKKNVLLVDTDYHRSTLSEVLGVHNAPGLVDVLQGKTGIKDALVPAYEGRVQFLPSGKGDPDTADLLSSDTMTRLLLAFKSRADVVIIDSPPFILADALDLATRVDGVILVVRARQTLRPALVKMVHQIRRAEIPMLGIVMNGVPQEDKRYDRYYSRKQDTVKETLPASISEVDEETGLDAQVAAAPEA